MLTNLLINTFIGKNFNTKDSKIRTKFGFLSGVTGCICNLILFTAKIIIGTVSGSISITADAINNLSDMGSSAVSLFGFKMSSRPADEEHPFGHGRYEYISALVVALIIMTVGLELIKSSIDKIINPTEVSVSFQLVIVLVISILVKLWMFLFNRKLGKTISSQVLTATASDSINDCISTGAVLVASIIGNLINFSLDGYMGIAVAIFIMISGIGIIKESLGPILGEAPDKEMVTSLCTKVLSYDGIIGIHDLVIHNYGPSKWMASLHAEVPSDVNVMRSHDLIDIIERDVKFEMGIELVIHMDPIVIKDDNVNETRRRLSALVKGINENLSIHDFRMVKGPFHTNLIFDVLVPYNCKLTEDETKEIIQERVNDEFEGTYYTVINIDRSYSSVYENM